MIKRFGLICGAAFLLLFSFHGFLHGEELSVVFTSNSAGKLSGCSCPSDPYGGLSERVTLIRDLRQFISSPFLLVDSGNMNSLFGEFEAKAECVFNLMNLMEYDAAGVGCNEMFHGMKSAMKISRAADFPLTSAVFAKPGDMNGGSPAFKPYVISDIDGKKVGIISVCDSLSQTRLGSPRIDDYIILPMDGVVSSAISEISETCDFIIVLSNLSHEANIELSDKFAGIDLIVEGYGNSRYGKPIETSNSVIVSPGNRGQFVGLITLDKQDSGKISVKHHELIPVLDMPEDKAASELIMEYLYSLD
ncbi:hypothetical protein ACFL6K_05465 [Candidatus Latescibacterota bacterium]